MKIVHITSAHPALDSRIFYKQCVSLSQAGHEVHLVAYQTDAIEKQGIRIHAVNKEHQSRWRRMHAIYQLVTTLSADVYHFHDPEFIAFALLLKLTGRRVVYDVHEDTATESLSFNKYRPVIKLLKFARWRLLEKIANIFFDGFICATPHIARHFCVKKTRIVRNYARLDEFNPPQSHVYQNLPNTVLYVGGIMKTRGVMEMIQAVAEIVPELNATLKMIGFFPHSLRVIAQQSKGWHKVQLLDWLTRDSLLPHFFTARVGLVLLHPEPNFKEALPIKLFEYMAAGLPVIASDFPIWRQIITTADCGFVVDPFNVTMITDKIQYLLEHPLEAEAMGQRGRKAVAEQYNWVGEATTLNRFYLDMIDNC